MRKNFLMCNEFLTICIPSFNRPDKLQKLLENLASQEGIELCKIIIHDNKSEPAYRKALSKFIRHHPDLRLEIYENVANVGMSGNILKCFEIRNSEWLWIMSDDDELLPSAIKLATKTMMEVSDDIDIIKFSSDRSQPEINGEVIDDIKGLIKFCDKSKNDFNSFIFLTNCIYRLRRIQNLADVGYRHAHTYVPHFMMISKLMDDGGKIYISSQQIVNYVRPKIGYSYSLVGGIGVGALKEIDLNFEKKIYAQYISLFFPHNDWKVMIDLRYYCLANEQSGRFAYLAKQYITSASYSRTYSKLIMLTLFRYLVAINPFFKTLIYILSKVSTKYSDELDEMKYRYRSI